MAPLLLAAMVVLARLYPQWQSQAVIGATIILSGMGLYMICVPPAPILLEAMERVEMNGRIGSIPYYDDGKSVFVLHTDTDNRSPYTRRIRVVCMFDAGFHRGDMVCVEGKLKPPRPPGNPGQFDFPAYLANQGIYYNLTIKETSMVRLLSPASGPVRWMDTLRSRAEDLTRQRLSSDEAAILLGMLWGGRGGMEDQQYEDFQKTGIVHLFSVGGLHVGFLLLLVNGVASLVGLGNRGRFGAGVSVLIVYGTMVAWPPPVIRAVMMGGLGLLAYLSGRENGLINALAISGVFILLVDPAQLFNLSFQLTMLATAGLVYLFPLLRARLPGRGWVKDLVLIPVCAEIAILPLVAYHFNILTPGSLLTNIATTYLAGGAVILGFIASCLAPLSSSLASIFLYPAGMFIEMIMAVVDWVKVLPGAYLYVATPCVLGVWLYYGSLLLALFSWRVERWRRLFKPAVAVIMVWLAVLVVPAGYRQSGQVEMVFIDVGQGDSILVKSPGGKFILVDGGGSQLFDVGGGIVLPYLRHRGIRQLDMVISTHPDIDHYQGLLKVMQAIPVGCVGLPAVLADAGAYQELRQIAAQRNIPLLGLYAGQSVGMDQEFHIDVLHPKKQDGLGDPNQNSLVLMIGYKKFNALLTADVSADELKPIGDTIRNPITIVKIPHHGSKGSLAKDFYYRLEPPLAVISVGADNPFGHPHPSVLSALEDAGTRILRTDVHGAVVINSNGCEYMIATTLAEPSK